MLEKFPETVQRFLDLLLVQIDIAQRQVCKREVRVQGNRLAAALICFGKIPIFIMEFGQIEMTLRVFGLERKGLLEAIAGFIITAGRKTDVAQ